METEKPKGLSKSVLGKGLSSLLPTVSIETVPEFTPRRDYFVCPIEQIYPNPDQPRKDFDEESLSELAESIREKGIIQPLVVKKTEKGYMLIAGERRWRAAQKAKRREVPVIVRDVPDREILELALIENIQREDLSPIDTALAFEKLIIDLGLTQEEVSDRVGKDRSTIANALRLLKLPQEIQESLRSRKITEGHARALLAIPNRDEQVALMDEIVRRGLSVREVERRAKGFKSEDRADGTALSESGKPSEDRTHLESLERSVASFLGTKVSINGKADLSKGQIVIDFFSKEDLERILDLIRN